MVKRSTITKIYDKIHIFGVRACWFTALAGASVILAKSFEILFFPKQITIEDLPEYKRIMALKEKELKEDGELLKE